MQPPKPSPQSSPIAFISTFNHSPWAAFLLLFFSPPPASEMRPFAWWWLAWRKAEANACRGGKRWVVCPWWRPWAGPFYTSLGWLEYWLAAPRWDLPQRRACDGLLYLPGLSSATPQYSCRIKWQAIYNTSVRADCIHETFFSPFTGWREALNVWLAPTIPTCLFLMCSSYSRCLAGSLNILAGLCLSSLK